MKNIYFLLAVIVMVTYSSCIEIHPEPIGFPDLEVEHSTIRDFSSLTILVGNTNDTVTAQGTEIVRIKLFNYGDGVAYDVEYEIIRTLRLGYVTSETYYAGDIYPYEGVEEVVEYKFNKLDKTSTYEVIASWY